MIFLCLEASGVLRTIRESSLREGINCHYVSLVRNQLYIITVIFAVLISGSYVLLNAWLA